MSADRPWEAGPFSKWVIDELNNRIKYLSSGIIQSPENSNGAMKYSSGPRRHWIKVFSNGMNKTAGKDTNNKWGLLLKSGDSFSERYGISNQEQTYGYSNDGSPKIISNQQFRINVPEPGIVSFTVDVQKNFFATGKINWICHSIDQLKALTPYFLTPLVTVFVEWGWNNFDVASLINYKEITDLKSIVKNHFEHYDTKVPKSKGNYDFMVGDVTNFEYGFDDNIIKGYTEIRSRQMLYTGFNVRGDKSINLGSGNNATATETPALSFKTLFQQTLKTLVSFSDNGEFPVPPDPSDTSNPERNLDNDNIKLHALLSPYRAKYGQQLNDLPNYVYKFPNRSKTSGLLEQQGSDNSLLDTYITMELFVDIMNSLKNKNSEKEYLKDFFEVDVVNSNVGYHPNLISTSKDVLIPNSKSPKFNGSGSISYNTYKDEVTTFIGDDKSGTDASDTTRGQLGSVFRDFFTGQNEESQNKKGQAVGESMSVSVTNEKITLSNIKIERKNLNTNPADIQLKLLIGYGKQIFRNDLDVVLNYYGRNLIQTRENTAFDEKGLLKNVYINLNFIIDSLVVDDDVINMKDMYDKVLSELNESVCDFWNLELVNVDAVKPDINKKGGLQIVDVKYKASAFNLGDIFTFDYGSNKSIVKKINFTTSLTNGMANQILYRSFGEKSLSSNNLIDFSNEGVYVDRIKDEEKDKKNTDNSRGTYSDQMLTFLSVIKKYMNFQPENPDAGFLMRVQVYKASSGNVEERTQAIPVGGGFGGVGTISVKVANFSEYNIADLCIPDKEALVYLLNDEDKKGNTNVYCAPIRNVELEISLMGIAGIKVFQFFKVRNLPPPFTDDVVVFQVRDVNHTLDENGWETRIKASVRPAYNLQQTTPVATTNSLTYGNPQ